MARSVLGVIDRFEPKNGRRLKNSHIPRNIRRNDVAFMRKVFEKGTVKVVWVDKNAKQIHSRMFYEQDDAIKFSKGKKDFLVFKLLKQKSLEDFSWEILPYGKYKLYNLLMKNYRKYKTNLLKLALH